MPPELLELLRRQHGAFTRDQAERAGVSYAKVWARVTRGQWHRLFPGVYAEAGSGRRAHLMAALLYAGPGAALHGRTALEREGLVTPTEPVHVVVPTSRRVRTQPGLVVHRSGSVQESDVWVRDGLTLARVERALVDLVREAPRREVGTAVCAALQRGLTTGERIREAATRTCLLPRCRWFARLLDEAAGGAESVGELDLLRLCRRHRLPPPRLQARLGRRRRSDLGRPELGVYVGVDSLLYRVAVEDWRADLERHNEIMVETGGICLLRFTVRQIREEPETVARILRQALAQARRRLAQRAA